MAINKFICLLYYAGGLFLFKFSSVSLPLIISIIFSAFAAAAAGALTVLKFFPRWGLMDKPEKYGISTRPPIPYPGGVAIYFAVVVCVLSWAVLGGLGSGTGGFSSTIGAVLLGATLLAATCFWDDRRGLSPFLRLGVQIAAAGLLVIGGIGVASITNPLGGTIVLDSINIPINFAGLTGTFTVFADILTIIWVVAMINAFNWVDGVPGMASSLSVVASGVLLALSAWGGMHSVDQTLAITLSAIIFGASSAFLIFDFPRPRMLMGDTGSMLLGFLLAVTAIISGGKIATTMLVLGFPILDFAWVILRRILKGQSPFYGDLWHFHHRLLKAGYSERATVLIFASASLIFGLTALLLHTEGKAIAFFVLLAVMILFATLLYSRREQ